MSEHTLEDLYDEVAKLKVRCEGMSTDICWIKKILWLLILIGLGAIGVQVPRYFM